MLDLQARVHFEKEELLRRRVDDELHRSRGSVADGASHSHRGVEHPLADGAPKAGCGRLFDDLLIAALHRTVALSEDDHVAPVAEDLDFDVLRALDESLEVRPGVSEVRLPEALDRLECGLEFATAAADTEADPAASRGALEHDRVADVLGALDGRGGVRQKRRPRQERHAVLRGDLARTVLQAELAELQRRGPDEAHPRGFARFCELGALAQEAVSRMDRFDADLRAGLQDTVAPQVALGRPRAADRDGLVGLADVPREGVGVGVNGHAADAHGAQRTEDAAGDLAAVRDQDLSEHRAVSSPGSRRGRRSAWGCTRCRDC